MFTTFKKLLCTAFVVGFLLCSLTVTAENDGRHYVETSGVTDSYTYSKVKGGTEVVSSPHTYLPRYIVNSDSLGHSF